jgi:hypothetical protein
VNITDDSKRNIDNGGPGVRAQTAGIRRAPMGMVQLVVVAAVAVAAGLLVFPI